MAHAAKIENGIVTQVIVIPDLPDESDASVQAYVNGIGLPGEWVRTSYNATIRGKFAGVGDIWNGVGFVAQPDSAALAYERGKADGTAEAMLTLAPPESI